MPIPAYTLAYELRRRWFFRPCLVSSFLCRLILNHLFGHRR